MRGGPWRMLEQFLNLLSAISERGSFCLDCLSRIYGAPTATISGYVGRDEIVSGEAVCSNCGVRTTTFRVSSSSQPGGDARSR
jgi:hypothetical protein